MQAAITITSLKLNLGSGDALLPGYLNLDRKFGDEVFPLDYRDGEADEIRAAHILEHFGFHEVPSVLREWVRVLKVGGWLRIAVPDFDWIVRQYVGSNYPTVPSDTPAEALIAMHSVDADGVSHPIENYLLGGQEHADDFHKILFNEWKLTALMRSVGLTNIRRWASEVQDCASMAVSLNLEGQKS